MQLALARDALSALDSIETGMTCGDASALGPQTRDFHDL
jgi:hypothetical protein